MDIRIVVSNVVAGIILIVAVIALVYGNITAANERMLDILVGASITYLFTENVMNGRVNKDKIKEGLSA